MSKKQVLVLAKVLHRTADNQYSPPHYKLKALAKVQSVQKVAKVTKAK